MFESFTFVVQTLCIVSRKKCDFQLRNGIFVLFVYSMQQFSKQDIRLRILSSKYGLTFGDFLVNKTRLAQSIAVPSLCHFGFQSS